MNMAQVKEIANAILYEGYMLYPYRTSAIKNRQRWTFGVVYPHAYAEVQGETWTMRTECLIERLDGARMPRVEVTVRFLHLLERTPQDMEDVAQESWEEGVVREIVVPGIAIDELLSEPRRVAIELPASRMVDGRIVRWQRAIQGMVTVSAALIDKHIYKVHVLIENTTPETAAITSRRDTILPYSFVSTHTILQAYDGAFISLLEPPDALSELAKMCQNEHTWPVLVGNAGERDVILSSPIILYDYPQIAPESFGPLFDGTEIDEILILRILTLTDEEKETMRQGDERVRAILEQVESMSPEDFMRLHGTIRDLHAVEGER